MSEIILRKCFILSVFLILSEFTTITKSDENSHRKSSLMSDKNQNLTSEQFPKPHEVITYKDGESPEFIHLVGVLQDFVEQNFNRIHLNDDCHNELILIRNGLRNREVWALKLLDASSHIGGDFVWGNNFFVGSLTGCDLVNEPIEIKLAPERMPRSNYNMTQAKPPFPVDYRAVHGKHQTKMQLFTDTMDKLVLDFGFCLPASCTNEDVKNVSMLLFNNISFTRQTLTEDHIEFVHTKSLKLSNEFYESNFVKAFLYIVSIVAGLVVINLILKCATPIFIRNNSIGSTLELKSMKDEKQTLSMWERVIYCFSITDNVKTIASTEIGSDSIEVIHGLRVITMILFITGHIALFGLGGISNSERLYALAEVVYLQPLAAMRLFLDTFFVISATISSYIFFQYLKKHKPGYGFVLFIKAVVSRYVRLTPPYLIQMLMVMTLSRLIKEKSPYYLSDDNEAKCEKFWWKNMFYISNYDPFKDMCMMWGWFLSHDFQCFIVGMIILLIYSRNRLLGKLLFVSLIMGPVLYCGYLGYTIPFSLTVDTLFHTGPYLYTPIWAHLPSYLVGLGVGWYLSVNEKKFPIRQAYATLGLFVSMFIMLALIFGHAKNDISPVAGMFYAAFYSLSWGLTIGWIILVSSSGKGLMVERCLKAKLFIPLSRICYSAYLVNPSVIMGVIMFNSVPITIDLIFLPVLSFGFATMVFITAFFFTLLFEAPFVKLNKLIGI